MDEETKKFYVEQSVYSDPGLHVQLFENLPLELPALCKILRGIIYSFDMLEEVPMNRVNELNTRYTESILERIIEYSNEPLSTARDPEKRFLGECRDISLLLCSILRHHGVPARIRSGYAPYINIGSPGFNVHHVIVEMWDTELDRWRLVDPSQSIELIEFNNIDFDVTDIPRGEFVFSGDVWRGYRGGTLDPDRFGDAPDSRFKGVSMVKNRLIQDFHMLNKQELLIWDSTPLMDLHIIPTEEDEALIDRAAQACITYSDDAIKLRELYDSEPKLQVQKIICSYNPFDDPRAVYIK